MVAKTQLKRLVAREGLILLGIALAGFLFEVAMVTRLNMRGSLSHSRITYLYDLDGCLGRAARFLIYGYPAYLVVRFVVWSVKTLTGKR